MRNAPLALCLVFLVAAMACGCSSPTDKFMSGRPKIEASAVLLVTPELTDYPLLGADDLADDYVLPAVSAAFARARAVSGPGQLEAGELLVVPSVAVRRDEMPHYIQHTAAVVLMVRDAAGNEIASGKGDGVARSGTISPTNYLIFYPVAVVLKLFTDPIARSGSQREAIEWAVYDAVRKLHGQREVIERGTALKVARGR